MLIFFNLFILKNYFFEFLFENNLFQSLIFFIKKCLKIQIYLKNYKNLFIECIKFHLNDLFFICSKMINNFSQIYNDYDLLLVSTKYQNILILKYLINEGYNINQQNQLTLNSSLHISSRFQYLEIIEFLLNKGADINIKNKLLIFYINKIFKKKKKLW